MSKLDQLRALREARFAPVAVPAVQQLAEPSTKAKRDRKDYMRDYMRQKRAKEKQDAEQK